MSMRSTGIGAIPDSRVPSTSGAIIGQERGALYEAHGVRTDLLGAPLPSGRAQPAEVGFGCAGLMQVPSPRLRQKLLAEAFEQGIRHFDVARMYGLGAAEREVGQFARGRRDQLTIATKFGIEPTGAVGRLAGLQAPARAVIARFPALRRALKRRAASFHQPHRYDAVSARASLQTSLRELATDYVDILFVHGPELGEQLDLAELGGTLEELRAAGLIRAWGFAGEPEPCVALSRAATSATVLQVREDIFDQFLSDGEAAPSIVTFGLLGQALDRVLRHVAGSAERRARWNRAVGQDCARSGTVAGLLLQDALARNPGGRVLFSTTRPERVRIATVAARERAREADPASLHAFRELVRSELGCPPSAHG